MTSPSVSDIQSPDGGSRRLAAYGYLAPLFQGKRVLEVGAGEGAGAARIMALGAKGVLGVDINVESARSAHRRTGLSFRPAATPDDLAVAGQGPFDVIVLPAATQVADLLAWRRLLSPGGRLVVIAANADRIRRNGVGFYDLVEALEPAFPRVRMFGVTPFFAFGVAEFDEASGGLRIDSGLVDEAAEEPSHYIAVAGPDEPFALGYALVQIPAPAVTQAAAAAASVVAAPAAREPGSLSAFEAADLRRRLAEIEGQGDGVLRVSRAQAEEIEELRGRLRRGAEARAELDEELSRLRRALTEADESVLNLTRRTTEEMSALAQRITAGLRVDPVIDSSKKAAAHRQELEAKDLELEAAGSALTERDERIAALEVEKQDLVWRLEQAEANVRKLSDAVAAARATAQRVVPQAPAPMRAAPAPVAAAPARMPDEERALFLRRQEELVATLRQRDQALDQFRQAGRAHMMEVNRLRAALDEQAVLVNELEEEGMALVERLGAAEAEAARLRAGAGETEGAERTRRSRLAELEGKLLRLQREAAQAKPASTDGPALDEAVRTVGRLQTENAELSRLLARAESGVADAGERWNQAVERIVGLEQEKAERDSLAQSGEIARQDLERRLDEGAGDRGGAARLQAALRDTERLRYELERSEERLWEAKGKLLRDQERIATLEKELGSGRAAVTTDVPREPEGTITVAAHRAIVQAALAQLSEIEAALREEIIDVRRLEQTVAAARALHG